MSSADSAPSAGQLAQSIEEYLAEHPAAALLEDGRVLFDMRTARYAVSEQHGRCLLQLWSEERNLMRTVVEVQERAAMPAPAHAPHGRGQAAGPGTGAHQRPAHAHRARLPRGATTSGCWSAC